MGGNVTAWGCRRACGRPAKSPSRYLPAFGSPCADDVIDVVADEILAVSSDALLHLLRREAVILPDDRDGPDVDCGAALQLRKRMSHSAEVPTAQNRWLSTECPEWVETDIQTDPLPPALITRDGCRRPDGLDQSWPFLERLSRIRLSRVDSACGRHSRTVGRSGLASRQPE